MATGSPAGGEGEVTLIHMTADSRDGSKSYHAALAVDADALLDLTKKIVAERGRGRHPILLDATLIVEDLK